MGRNLGMSAVVYMYDNLQMAIYHSCLSHCGTFWQHNNWCLWIHHDCPYMYNNLLMASNNRSSLPSTYMLCMSSLEPWLLPTIGVWVSLILWRVSTIGYHSPWHHCAAYLPFLWPPILSMAVVFCYRWLYGSFLWYWAPPIGVFSSWHHCGCLPAA